MASYIGAFDFALERQVTVMKGNLSILLISILLLGSGVPVSSGAASLPEKRVSSQAIIADHNKIRLDRIPTSWAQKARQDLHIAYGHTSHGSQITFGMMGLRWFKNEPFIYEEGAPAGSIDLRDNPFGGDMDLGNPDNKTWAAKTRNYLEKNKEINVVMWSWCGQLCTADSAYVKNYLDLMQGLESDYPNVTFIYMTGHLDDSGKNEALTRNNNQIREFCRSNNKVLYDFADIESYDPDGNYYGDKYTNPACWYDSNDDGKQDRNWAQDWQSSHKKDVDWYDCYAAHTEPVNANMKAYAMWWLLARVAGWDGVTESASDKETSFVFYAEKLQSLSLFKGTGQGYDLGRAPTRIEGAVMLTRLLGGEQEALKKLYQHPFKDAVKTWGNPYVGYLNQYNLTKGISEGTFGCDLKLEPATYTTFLLRVLGYSDKPEVSDFQWNNAIEKARDVGIINVEYYQVLKKEDFNRGHMAKLTYLSLKQKMKGESRTLLEKLVAGKAIDKKTAEQL